MFLVGFVPGKSFATDYSGTWSTPTGVTVINACPGTSSNYTLKATTSTDANAAFATGKAVVITFPTGFTLSSISSGTIETVSITNITTTATTISFNVPANVSVAKNKTFTIVLNGITNNNTAGNYQLSMKIDNSTGTGTGNQNIFCFRYYFSIYDQSKCYYNSNFWKCFSNYLCK
ncbi:MAG: hypothetical protein WKG06_27270 [Segetibacter sp.]